MRKPKKSSIHVKIRTFSEDIIHFLLELMAEIIWPLIKSEARFIFKEHPIVTILTIILCVFITTSIGLASDKRNENVKERVQEMAVLDINPVSPVTYKRVEMDHTIQNGETLLGLACKYSKSGESPNEWISNVKQMNSIKNENWIKTGTKIKIYTWEVQ